MRNLEQFSLRDEFLQLRKDIHEYPIIQGITLDYHPIWLRAWNGFHTTGRHEDVWWWGPRELGNSGVFVAQQSYDPQVRLPLWERYLTSTGRPLATPPIYVRLSIRLPVGDSEERSRHQKQRFQLLAMLPRYPFLVVLEDRPAASLFATATAVPLKGGFAISGGTVGGVMLDTNSGDHFALTCAHVVNAGQQQTFTDNSGAKVALTGTCAPTHHFAPKPNIPGAQCNPGVTNCIANQVDVAFLRLSGKVAATQIDQIGTITGVSKKSDLSPKQTIQLTGQTTGNSTFEVGGLGVAYEFDFNGKIYCFENLFEVRDVLLSNLMAPLQRAMMTVPSPGDSGAWICVPTKANTADFAGMLLGGDALMGYAMFTDVVSATARGEKLNFLPI